LFERNYKKWINSLGDTDTPVLIPEITTKYVFPAVQKNDVSVFICDRLPSVGPWLMMEKHLSEYFKMKRTIIFQISPQPHLMPGMLCLQVCSHPKLRKFQTILAE